MTLALVLIIAGLLLAAVEAHTPTYGVLAIIGLGSALAGVGLLVASGVNAVVWVAAIVIVAIVLALTLVAVYKVARSQRWRPQTGVEEMRGCRAVVIEDFTDGHGWVRFEGARWQAVAESALRRGDEVVVEDLSGLELRVSQS